MTDSHTQPAVGADSAFRGRLEARIAELCEEREALAGRLSPDAASMVRLIRQLASGGKRVRALLAFHAHSACGGSPEDPRITDLGVAIELFQAAALIHDDILDRSDTRRGAPSVHRAFESLHREAGWGLDPARFGESAAILTGDLALAMADETFARLDARAGSALRDQFDTMKWEVMAGQYLDIVEEVSAPVVDTADAASRAMTVLRYKSAKYTFEHPTVLGAHLAGASAEDARRLAEFALPLGEAYQLADDDLGVFGDPAVTGKPAGDDLLEGKRTVLVAFALERATEDERRVLEHVLGNPSASPGDVDAARAVLESTGARDRALAEARRLVEDGLAHLEPLFGAAAADQARLEGLDALKGLALAAVSRVR
ncbi:polyprenyl synthetase family protein [Falsarthrobacter nasiphocae]|uniref:Geranylgeranyl diphosphate synthase type I n=1 Tax=Falsarthrobacter nasiphocae TaxID=189863 RepID=A0AAE3YDS8_9MICC|nr:polyprenyl synthetase family protein [Falsarthrobacter nasiphocae]MDR6891330.1 geranylgeranyl diphosphate synthase type I [Falsarthrobacter nasiphocae]